ncbi:MAG: glycosyltransferase family 2 protein [Candidatus Omnitrophica bacterium]|nr:glycosyltransferase family 2 protein [Candidatus Omnitrophota bacterium]
MGDCEKQIDISVVIPVYNEESNLLELHRQLNDVLSNMGRSYEIIAVDDGSSDDSFEVLRRLHGQDEHLVAVRFRRNFGQTAAFSAGFDLARGQIVITMDADLQNDPVDIPHLIEMMEEGYDVVSGWRKDRKDPFVSRRLPSIMANRLISFVTGVKLHDYGCSLKAYRGDVVKNLHLYGEMHRFIPALANWMGVSVTEIAVRHHPRRHGKSKYGISRTLKVILDLLTVRFLLSFSARPMQLFGLLGMGSFGVGFLIGLYLTVLKVIYGQSISNRPLLLLGVLMLVAGIQLTTMGLLAELIVRTYHETQDKAIYVIREVLD